MTIKKLSTEIIADFIQYNPGLLVLTGAGVSAASGIPTYRDHGGKWQSNTPIQHQEFINEPAKRKRYWARSAIGWQMMSRAKPNLSHKALAKLESGGFISLLVTQNVDRLHQKAGHQKVIDLHGRVDQTICLSCNKYEPRAEIQTRLLNDNPDLVNITATPAPDGDAHVNEDFVNELTAPTCLHCNGILMPDVVFFGGTVPKDKVEQASTTLLSASALLVVGSSLMVYSGFRFCKLARKTGIPIIAINRGKTRADDILTTKFEADCGETLKAFCDELNL